jgi:Tfp pilus assembly protein PilN
VLKEAQFWVLTMVAALTALLTIANIVLFQSNRTIQTDVTSRQQFIQQSIQLEGLYRELIKALADLSVRNQDPELANLLGTQGISVPINAPKPASGTPAEPSKKGAQ